MSVPRTAIHRPVTMFMISAVIVLEMIDDTMAKVRTNTNKLTMGVKDYSKEMAVEQLDNVSEAAQAGKKAIQNS